VALGCILINWSGLLATASEGVIPAKSSTLAQNDFPKKIVATMGVLGAGPISMQEDFREYDQYNVYDFKVEDDLKYEIFLHRDGRLYNNKNKLVSNWMFAKNFVLDPSGRMYLFPSLFGILHHSSPTGGDPVLFAAEMRVIAGVIYSISNTSGHYKPSFDVMLKFLATLDALDAPVNNIRVYRAKGVHAKGRLFVGKYKDIREGKLLDSGDSYDSGGSGNSDKLLDHVSCMMLF
jgi:hypothetical protein